jgi:hypothetical protein
MKELTEDMLMEVDPFEGDFGDQSDQIFTDKFVTARKEHECSCCGKLIVCGERYRSMTGRFDGELMGHKFRIARLKAMALEFVGEQP